MFVITTHGGLYPSILDRTGLLCCLLAAIVHDFEHTGFTNDYLINTEHPIAMTYNNKAPQENHHVAAALQLLVQPEFNFLEGFGWEARLAIRRRVIDMVLATDMKAHMDIMAQFQHQLHPAEKVTHEAGSSSHQSNAKAAPLSMDSHCDPVPEQVSIALQMAIKVADVAHLAAAFPVHYRWVKCLEEEFFLQGDHEAAQELAVTRFMDRQQQGVSQSQAGFFEVIALPMFMTFVHVFPCCQPMLELVLSNYEDWRSLNDVRLAQRPAPIWHMKPVVADRKRKHSTFYESATSSSANDDSLMFSSWNRV
ncbi:hypothetical protein WJX72_000032 [[Myrmecia] bisecta]|uniref:PDEase domain-containing protein n=1 Tax=[Myrmecia] bisecta TaxID=41462 RepID=A0AAW1QNV0_9CHLO